MNQGPSIITLLRILRASPLMHEARLCYGVDSYLAAGSCFSFRWTFEALHFDLSLQLRLQSTAKQNIRSNNLKQETYCHSRNDRTLSTSQSRESRSSGRRPKRQPSPVPTRILRAKSVFFRLTCSSTSTVVQISAQTPQGPSLVWKTVPPPSVLLPKAWFRATRQ